MERAQANQDRVRQLMAAFRAGDRRAANELIEIFQPELRRLAAAKMRKEDSAHSWQPTLLVNELYLEMVKVRALRPAEQDAGNDRAAFLSLAGLMMTRLLIHHSRPLSQKAEKCEIDADAFETPGPASLVEIDRLLERLESFGPRLRYIVELRVFEDLTGERSLSGWDVELLPSPGIGTSRGGGSRKSCRWPFDYDRLAMETDLGLV